MAGSTRSNDRCATNSPTSFASSATPNPRADGEIARKFARDNWRCAAKSLCLLPKDSIDSAPPWNSTTTHPDLRSAHVIVVGNEKGGAGKSTLSIHLSVALLKAGYKVACIDLDTRQQTLTRFFENRKSWSANAHWPIELPRHCAMARGQSNDVRANEAHEFALFAEAIGAVEHEYEFVVIDTPASDSYLMRLAHSLADTLVSPLNDSYIDIDVFSRVHHDRSQRGAVAQYAEPRHGGATQAPPRRQRRHRLGDGAQPHGLDRQQQRPPDRGQRRAAGDGIALSRRRRPARPRHLSRIVSDRPHRARPDRGRRRRSVDDFAATRRGAKSKDSSRRSICPRARRASSTWRRAARGTRASRIIIANSAPSIPSTAERRARAFRGER